MAIRLIAFCDENIIIKGNHWIGNPSNYNNRTKQATYNNTKQDTLLPQTVRRLVIPLQQINKIPSACQGRLH